MNIKNISRILLITSVLFVMSGCTYHKAMDVQHKRQEIINANLGIEQDKKIQNENEYKELQAELADLKAEVSGLDREMAKIKARSQSTNKEKAQQELNQQLAMLKKQKASLEKEIAEKQKLIEVYSY